MLIRASVACNTSISSPKKLLRVYRGQLYVERCTSSDKDEDSMVSWLLESSCRKLSQNTKTRRTVLG